MATLTSEIQALITYANEVTGEADTTLGEAVHTLADGYGQGGGDEMAKGLIDGSLTNVVIPNGVTSIRDYAFYRSKVESVVVPNSVTNYGTNIFESCSKLTSVTIPENVTKIPGRFCSLCTSLTSINIPDGVINIYDYAFYNCTSLTSINIPNSVTTIGESAFRLCTAIDTLVVPSSVTNIGTYAFLKVKKVVYSGTATGSPWGAKEVVSE